MSRNDEAPVRIGPSILTADLLRLGDEIRGADHAGVDFIHLDVMDGQFVPNISFGPLIVEAVRRATSLPLDVHLMIVESGAYVSRFVDAGADAITVHVEACPHLHRVVQAISSSGLDAGVAINPATPLSSLEEIAPLIQQVLVMSIDPGFGGQPFLPSALGKIARIRALLDRLNPACRVKVDGGVKASNAAKVIAAGADSLVAGSALFSPDRPIAEALRELRASIPGD